jgi:hypothetical protein
MKSLLRKLCLMTGVSGLVLVGGSTPVLAADDNPAGPEARLQRLEQRLDELAQRQEQLMRRLEAPQENRDQTGRRFGAPPERQVMPPPGSENLLPSMPPAGPPHPLLVRIHRLGDLARVLFLGFMVCNILLAIWIFTDSRKRGEGSGLFIALALVAGIPAAVIYALVRIGDKLTVPVKPPAG